MKNYESHIKGNKPTVVDFYAEWCQPCKLMEPILHEVKSVAGERATILSIDIDNESAIAKLYNIQTVPTLIIFHKGQILWRKNGISPAHEILEHLQVIME